MEKKDMWKDNLRKSIINKKKTNRYLFKNSYKQVSLVSLYVKDNMGEIIITQWLIACFVNHWVICHKCLTISFLRNITRSHEETVNYGAQTEGCNWKKISPRLYKKCLHRKTFIFPTSIFLVYRFYANSKVNINDTL